MDSAVHQLSVEGAQVDQLLVRDTNRNTFESYLGHLVANDGSSDLVVLEVVGGGGGQDPSQVSS